MCRAPSAGQPSLVVAEKLVARSVVERRELGTALSDLAEFVTQPPAFGPAPQSNEAFPQRDHDGGRKRLPRAGGHFSGQTVGFRIFQAQRHGFLTSINIPYV